MGGGGCCSYPDRVLARSMEDRAGLLRLSGPYGLVPSATGSEHRPVTLTAHLLPPHPPTTRPSSSGGACRGRELWVCHVELCNFRFDADDWAALDVTGLSLVYPLPTEDPLAHQRRAEALLGTVRRGGRLHALPLPPLHAHTPDSRRMMVMRMMMVVPSLLTMRGGISLPLPPSINASCGRAAGCSAGGC